LSESLTLALAQINVTVGDSAGNAALIIRAAHQAAAQGAQLVLYPEMALTGYPPEDLVLMPAFRTQCHRALEQIARATAETGLALILGAPWEEAGHIYNASLLIEAGAVTPIRTKHDLPNYGVFDEKRIFAEGEAPRVLSWRGLRLGVLICEEVWDTELPKQLAAQGAEILLVQNASPYHIGKARERRAVVAAAARATGLPVVYLNLVGGQDELVFDGGSYAVDAAGAEVARLKNFEEELAVMRWEKAGTEWHCMAAPLAAAMPDLETLYRALVLGLRDYVTKNRFPGVVLGLSGGIDSGLTAAIAVDALGADKVLGVKLPSAITSRESHEDAEDLARRLAIRIESVPIGALMAEVDVALAELFASRAPDTTEENIQARLRGLLLMAVSNKFGHMLLTTGNKSEMSVGYATLYGDMCGGFSVLKDVYKTTVYKLCEWRNTQGAVIPERMLTKAPTAELREGQKDEDSLPPYPVLDTILRGLIERQLGVAELVAGGMEEALVTKIAGMVIGAEYKRRQSAPGVKVTPMAFGRDRRWPITNRWRYA
jgi:NAD+ synthase